MLGADHWPIMPTYRISVVNSDFSASEEHELQDAESAWRYSMKAAFEVGFDQIIRGEQFYGAEVSVHLDDQLLRRFMVSAGMTPLQQPPRQ